MSHLRVESSRTRFVRSVVAHVLPLVVVAGAVTTVTTHLTAHAAPAPSPKVMARPDIVSARLAAKAQGSRVEVWSLDTEDSTTWVNPGGSLTTDYNSQPVQAQNADGSWSRLDATLRTLPNGTVVPAVSAADVSFGAAGSKTAASLVGRDARTASFRWSGALPTPTLDGSTATYPNVYPGTNLTEAPTASGFEVSLQVTNAAAAAALPASVDLPLSGTGITWSLTDAGVLVGTDSNGKVVVTSAGAKAFDASLDPHTGDPVHSAPLSLSLSGPVGSQVLTVAMPQVLLSDPSTVWPVTIDPSTSWSSVAWTYVDSGFPTTSYYNANDVARVGTYSAGANVDRSLFAFHTSNLTGTHILAATLSLYETWSWSCIATPFDVWSSGAFGSSTTWNTQPSVYTDYATINSAKGYSASCPAGNVTADVRTWARDAAATGYATTYMEIRSQNETNDAYWKKFNPSATVSVTYNSYPGQPTGRSVTPCWAQCSTAPIMTNSLTPALTANTTDPDPGTTLTYDFEVWAGNSSSPTTMVASGSTSAPSGTGVSWTVPAGALANGSTYEYRVRAFDGTDYGMWSNGWVVFAVDTTPPAAPTISSTTHPAGQWTNSTTGWFSWTGSSDTYAFTYNEDGAGWAAWSSGSNVTWSNMTNNSSHTLQVASADVAGNVAISTYEFGVGSGALTSPVEQDRTQRSVTLSATGPESYVKYQWRRGTTAGWADIPATDLTLPSDNTTHPTYPTPTSGTWNWNVAQTATNAGDGSDGLIQIRTCFYASTTDTTPTCLSTVTGIQLVTHTFGASFATEPVGPGVVSLQTGDFQLSATDVSETGYNSGLSVGRTFTTLQPVTRTGASGVFGPGWVAALQGPDSGGGSLTPTVAADNSYIVLTDADGAASLYTASTALGTSPVSYTGQGDAADGSTLSYNYTASIPSITLTDVDGTTTIWHQAGGVWAPYTVQATGAAAVNTTTWFYNTSGADAGLPAQLVGAAPAGVTCVNGTGPISTAGCRWLSFTYTGVTVGQSTVRRLATVSLTAWNPAKQGGPGMDTIPVAQYDYDGAGRLAHAWDPRITPALKTAYSYDGNGRLSTLTPPVANDNLDANNQPILQPWTLHYNSGGQLTSLTRPDPAAGVATTTISYNVCTATSTPTGSSCTPGPLTLTAATAGAWHQSSDLPTYATAVFRPDHVPAGTPTSSDWPYATLHYLDVNGRETNTAVNGAPDTANPNGVWLYGATRYDQQGNVVWALTAGNRAQAVTPVQGTTDPYVAGQTDSGTRADLLATISTYNGDGTELVDVKGPMHPVVLNDGSTVDARAHSHTTFDENSPGGAIYRLPTTATTSALDSTGVDHDTLTSHTDYAGVTTDGTNLSGWALRQATSSTDPAGRVTGTKYDGAGRTVEVDLPHNASNAAARSTLTTYYSATGTGSCVDQSQAGLLCQTAPGDTLSGSSSPLPVVTYSYGMWGNVLSKTETYTGANGTTTRTTANTYDAAGRATGHTVTVSPAGDGGTALPAVSIGYDPNTGQPTTSTAGTSTLTTGYDTLGRAVSYTDATGNMSSTAYDLDGRPTTISDGKGSYSYTWDGTGEHRGVLTGANLGVAPAPSSFTASYDADGNATSVVYPNGLKRVTTFDNTGDPTALSYSMGSTTWLSFSQTANVTGATRRQSSPASSQAFAYDNAGRLTQTADTHDGTCYTRVYTLDGDSNRGHYASYPASSGTTCSTSTTATVDQASSFDAADRLTNTGYSYDVLGRTMTVPSSDAVGIGSHAARTGDLTLGYYANDLVQSQTQGGDTVTFALDPQQTRFASSTESATSVTTTNHYADGSDSPAWTSTSGTAWTRNLLGIDGGLAGTIDQTGMVTLDLVNMHGDLVATAADDTNATSTTAYFESTEYGAPRTPASAPDSYGWVGSKRRSTNDLGGLTLMGVRLYNPNNGRFLSVDPVPGGNDNAYVYVGNPIDGYDLDGRCGLWGKHSCYNEAKHAVSSAFNAVADATVTVAKTAWKYRAYGEFALSVAGTAICSLCTVAFYAGMALSVADTVDACARGRGGSCAAGLAGVAFGGAGRAMQRIGRAAERAAEGSRYAREWTRMARRNAIIGGGLGLISTGYSGYGAYGYARGD